MKIPCIASDWKTLFSPRKFGDYVNDHTLYQDHEGRWNLIGITSKTGVPSDERYFVHAVSENLHMQMREHAKVIDTGTLAWAPCVVRSSNTYYMYYGPSPTKMAVSMDSTEWFGHEIQMNRLEPMACHRDHFVLQLQENSWIMYASGIHNGKSSICCLESSNLLEWDFKGFALTGGEKSPLNPPWGAFESPYVVKKDGLYYLFTTYTDSSKENYHDTLVFCSRNPYDFGCFEGGTAGAVPLTTLKAHAPEIIQCENEFLITTCGWKNRSFAKGSVMIAKLQWK